jgi:glycine/D-amino acid oxidase-like deaminating enzyme
VHAFLTQDLVDAAAAVISQLKLSHPELAAQVELVQASSASEAADHKGRARLAELRIPHAKGAVVQKHAASLWPYKLVCWVLEQLLDRFPAPSFNLQTNTPATGLKRLDDGRWLVRTPRGTITAGRVLLCTNGYTSRLLPAFADLIVPVRGQVAALLPPRSPLEPNAPADLGHSYVFAGTFPKVGTGDRDEYLVQRPLPGGELIFGGGRNAAKGLGVGVWRDDEIEESVSTWLKTHLSPPLDVRPGRRKGGGRHDEGEAEPEAGDNATTSQALKASFEWTGVMGFSRDHHAWIGEVPESMGGGGVGGGLWICAGYTGHGMPVAPLSARAVARLMLGEDASASAGGDVEKVGAPRVFALTEDRINHARLHLETVEEREPKGLSGLGAAMSGAH